MATNPDDEVLCWAAKCSSYDIFKSFPDLFNMVLAFKTFGWVQQAKAAIVDDKTKVMLLESLGAVVSMLHTEMFGLVRSENLQVICTFWENFFSAVDQTPVHARNMVEIKRCVEDRKLFQKSRGRQQFEMRPEPCHLYQLNQCPNKPKKELLGSITRQWGPCAFKHFCVVCKKYNHGAVGCGLVLSKVRRFQPRTYAYVPSKSQPPKKEM